MWRVCEARSTRAVLKCNCGLEGMYVCRKVKNSQARTGHQRGMGGSGTEMMLLHSLTDLILRGGAHTHTLARSLCNNKHKDSLKDDGLLTSHPYSSPQRSRHPTDRLQHKTNSLAKISPDCAPPSPSLPSPGPTLREGVEDVECRAL